MSAFQSTPGMAEPDFPQGSIQSAVRVELDAAGQADTALGQLALTLAATLDKGAGLSTAAVSRELRATLATLREEAGISDDDPAGQLLSSLSSEAGYTS